MATASSTALVADIGGTNARFAIADLETFALRETAALRSASFASLQDAVQAYLASVSIRPDRACLALAGPVTGEQIRLTNLPWTFTRDELREACGLRELYLINDFTALANAVPGLGLEDLQQVGGDSPAAGATKVVLGPGTGLGLSGLVATGSRWVPVPGEGGHVSFPVRNGRELAIRNRIGDSRSHVSVEQLISGPGLSRLYTVLAELDGRTPAAPAPEEITMLASTGQDPIAAETLNLFLTWLGRFSGDMALAFGARGGVYLGGGIAPKVLTELQSGHFREAFDDKGSLSAYAAAIPVFVILARDAGLRGAAMFLSDRNNLTLQPAEGI